MDRLGLVVLLFSQTSLLIDNCWLWLCFEEELEDVDELEELEDELEVAGVSRLI